MFLFNNRTLVFEVILIRFVLSMMIEVGIAVAEFLAYLLDAMLIVTAFISGRSTIVAVIVNATFTEVGERTFEIESYNCVDFIREINDRIRDIVDIESFRELLRALWTNARMSVENTSLVSLLVSRSTVDYAISNMINDANDTLQVSMIVKTESGWFRNNHSLFLNTRNS